MHINAFFDVVQMLKPAFFFFLKKAKALVFRYSTHIHCSVVRSLLRSKHLEMNTQRQTEVKKKGEREDEMAFFRKHLNRCSSLSMNVRVNEC